MKTLSPKENLLRLIKFSDPEYIPFGLEATVDFFHRDALFYKGNGDPTAKRWTDAWGVEFEKADPGIAEVDGYPVYHPLMSLDELDRFPWPDPNAPGIMDGIVAAIKKVDRATTLVMVNNPGCMFVRSWLLMGLDNFLAAMLLEPGKVELLMDRVVAYQETIAKRYVGLGIDIAQLGDDAGTTKALMMRPSLWRHFVKPRLKRIIDIYKNAGCLVLLHCCGCIMEILDDIIDLDVDILNPVQAGANDLALLRAKTKGRVTLYGGIDAHAVATATPEKVSELTAETLYLLGEDGGYIASPDQVLPFPAENIEVMKKTVRDLGRFPFRK